MRGRNRDIPEKPAPSIDMLGGPSITRCVRHRRKNNERLAENWREVCAPTASQLSTSAKVIVSIRGL